jgi:hypothetical protein
MPEATWNHGYYWMKGKTEVQSIMRDRLIYTAIWTPVMGKELTVTPEDQQHSTLANIKLAWAWKVCDVDTIRGKGTNSIAIRFNTGTIRGRALVNVLVLIEEIWYIVLCNYHRVFFCYLTYNS